jgi:2-polyprenyl-3-methyl-5-hydroxy-6-metoxy-1,4-benzoquinol methylase
MSTQSIAQAVSRDETPAVCPHCSTSGRLVAGHVRDYVVGVQGEWDLFRCQNANCGLTFVFPQPTESQLTAYYQNYITHETPVFDETHHNQGLGLKALLKNSAAHRRRELIFLDDRPQGKVLEIGCGNGTNLVKLRKHGWDVVGQEIDPPAIAQARKLGIPVYECGLDQINPEDKFDAIILVHVIEHLLHPSEMLHQIREHLAPGGRLVLITPNPKSWGFLLFRRFWLPLAQPFHVRLYDLPALSKLVRKAGFKTTRLQTNSTHAASNIRGSVQAYLKSASKGSGARFLRFKLLANALELGLFFLLLLGDKVSDRIGYECVLICER